MFGHPVEHRPGRRGQPGAHHPDRAPVRFVGAGLVGARSAEFGQRLIDWNQPNRHGQFLLEAVKFVEVVRQRGVGGTRGGQVHHLGRDIGIAVAVTADPRSGPQNRALQQWGVRPTGTQSVPHRGIDLRDHLKERGRVVAQPRLDLVVNLQPGQPDQRGLPEGEDLPA